MIPTPFYPIDAWQAISLMTVELEDMAAQAAALSILLLNLQKI